MNRILKWLFEFILRRKLGLKRGPVGANIKWYESENVWAGIAVGLYGTYEIARNVIAPPFGVTLPPIPNEYLGYVSMALGGGIVWSRVTAKKQIK